MKSGSTFKIPQNVGGNGYWYFDHWSAKPGDDPKVCCDVCATSVQAISTSSDVKDSFNESAFASVLDLEDDKRKDNPVISRMISSSIL